MDELGGVIRAEIEGTRDKAISFERYMELALYHPTLGYYRRAAKRTGREGDFITSVSVGPMFGKLLARQFYSMWQKLKYPECWRLLEQGAENGHLAADIISWCRTEAPRFFAALRYELIEEDEGARDNLRQTFEKRAQEWGLEAGKVVFRGLDEGDEIGRGAGEGERLGVFFSNELVDAFPVRRVTRQEGRWREMGVGVSGQGELEWRVMEMGEGELAEAVRGLPEVEGYTTEINLRARRWMERVAGVLDRGYFVTIDYGFPASVYYAPFRTGGTLTAYRDHRRSEEVLRDAGRQDITAQVDFTALARAGERAGLETLGLVDQQRFLTGIAEEELAGGTDLRVGIAENPRAWQMLTHPNHFGSRFQVLVQGKNVPGGLEGLRFARAGGWD